LSLIAIVITYIDGSFVGKNDLFKDAMEGGCGVGETPCDTGGGQD
jgi:hypothetical protein